MTFLAANFPKYRRTKIGDFFCQIFATLFTHVGEQIRHRVSLSGLLGITNLLNKFSVHFPKGPRRAKRPRGSTFTMHSKFATAQ